jgi:hypothetical protein
MSEKAKQPKKHVLSVRVNEAEWNLLQQARRKKAIDVSTILRNGLIEFLQTTEQG